MLTIRRILRDYEDAGSLNGLIALWGFMDEHTFLTKAGHVGVVWSAAPAATRGVQFTRRRKKWNASVFGRRVGRTLSASCTSNAAAFW